MAFILCALFLPVASSAAAANRPAAETLQPPQAQALVQHTLAEEVRLASDTSHPMRYRLHRQSPRLTTTKEIIETRDGAVARLISVNDQPLNAADAQKEDARLSTLANDPSLQRHRKHREENDAGIVLKVLRMMPQAFLYQYAGLGQSPVGPVQRFTFRPNPRFEPPDLETQALTAMTGELWIDASAERVVRLAGSLQQDTSYGWGILGKLNKGGWLLIEQRETGNHQWRISHVQLKMSLRILIKNKIFDTDEQMLDYATVPAGIDYRAAIHLLREH